MRDAIASLQNIPQVPGRLELFTHPGGAQIFIDYAHTPDALENVCKTLKELAPPAASSPYSAAAGTRESAR